MKCGYAFKDNLPYCPNCEYTVYRPLPAPLLPKVDLDREREEIVEAMPYAD